MEFALVLAILLFALSLPFAEHPAGGSLRRAAGFAFAMAFIVALLGTIFAGASTPAKKLELAFGGCGVAAILLVLSFAAYGFLDLTKRGRSRQPSSHGEHVRFRKRRDSAGDDRHHDDEDAE